MGRELAYVLVNPYTISKSRTGGVIARYIGRTDLRLVGARLFGPCKALVERYADMVRKADPDRADTLNLIADYILRSYSPNPVTGRPRRVLMLLFEGEDAIKKIWDVTGSVTSKSGSGQTIRDTYGDFVVGPDNNVQYFEPAVLAGPSRRRVMATLSLWARYSSSDGGIISAAEDVPSGENIQRTLVMLKPDNFRVPSLRAGNIIDVLSSSGLRIVGAKKFSMTVAQAEEFYGPVREALTKKFRDIGPKRISKALKAEFGFELPDDSMSGICHHLGPLFAKEQFESIVHFMTGYKPSECNAAEKHVLGREECLALVYEGIDAVNKIRDILGPTDPSKAKPGSVRREFGSNIMVNAAHASDSAENARREMKIINVEEDTIKPAVDRYYGGIFSRIKVMGSSFPKTVCSFMRNVKESKADNSDK